MKYIHLPTGTQTDELPKSITIAGQYFVRDVPLPIDLCAKVGWRELPKTLPVATSADMQIVQTTIVQSADPLKAEYIVVERAKADILAEQEKAATEQAATLAQLEADRKAARDKAIEPWADDPKKQEIIGMLWDGKR